MKLLRYASAVAILAVTGGSGAHAYTLSQAAQPAERPPAGYTGDVYIDSRGCAYARASIGNSVNWAPLLSDDRKTVICGMTPTNAVARGGTPAPAAPAPSEPAPTALAAVAPEAETGLPSAPASPAADMRTLRMTCPADGSVARVRVGSDTVRVSCAAGQTQVTSYIVRHGDGSRTRLLVNPAPASAAPAPRVAAATGDVQPGGRVLIGGVPPGGPTNGFGSGYGVGSGPGVADPVPSANLPTVSHSPVVAGTITGSRSTASTSASTYPVGNGYGLTSDPGAAEPVPAVPEGYRAAWDDGRLNPNRGPQTAYGDQQMAALWDTSQVPMRRIAPQGTGTRTSATVISTKSPTSEPAAPAATSFRYVQVGAFRDAANAVPVAARLKALGLPGRVAQTRSGLNVVVAGPYDDAAALRNALAIAQRGFPDAYLRN